MPKRLIDGEGVWGSDKLAQVEPVWIRPEFANLIPLAFANGTFEVNPQRMWTRVYAYNRPDMTPQRVAEVLAEFERVKLLFRWIEPTTGKAWGYWVGINKPGRLPSQSRLDKKHDQLGPTPPADLLRMFLGIETNGQPMANPCIADGPLGFGSGLGLGSGLGSGAKANNNPVPEQKTAHSAPQNGDQLVEGIAHAYPNVALKFANRMLPSAYEHAVAGAIERECAAQQISEDDAARYLLDRTQRFAEIVARWPKDQHQFIPNLDRFFGDLCLYDEPEDRWVRSKTGTQRDSSSAPIDAIVAHRRSLGLNDDGTPKEQTA